MHHLHSPDLQLAQVDSVIDPHDILDLSDPAHASIISDSVELCQQHVT